MAGRLANMRFLAQRIMAPKAVLPVRGEGGGPVAMGRAINQPVSSISWIFLLARIAGLTGSTHSEFAAAPTIIAQCKTWLWSLYCLS